LYKNKKFLLDNLVEYTENCNFAKNFNRNIMATQEKFINPYTDFGFKKLFGTEANKDLLISFLNQLITEQGEIQDVQYLTAENLGRSEYDRRAIFDIKCTTDRGATFIVEMQKAKQNYFKDRSIFYTTFPIQQQAQQGEWNYKLMPVYFVGILDFVFDEDKDNQDVVHHEVMLIDTKTNKVFYNKLKFVYLEMPKFNKSESELETFFDKWLYVLKQLPRLERCPAKLQDKVFQKLFKVAELAKLPPQEAMSYEESLKIYRDNINILDTAKEEGRKEGLEKVAIAMYKRKTPIAEIAEITGLSEQQLNKIFK
jgi:predicted transposase/invertase (TIGR01784 family)